MASFNKQPKTYADQLGILASRGLVIADPVFAEKCLHHHNYYRLSAYRFPLTVTGNFDQFLANTTFEQLWQLYEFDRRLRHLVLEAAKRVEISARSRWAYELGHAHGPQAYEDPTLFASGKIHTQNLSKLDQEISRSKEEFIAHFADTYGMDRPPIWAACEVMTFGLVSNFTKQIKDAALRQRIADTYGLDEIVYVSFLHHLNTVRNACAHHGRLWNKRFTVSMEPPHTKPAALVSSFDPVPPASPTNKNPKAPNKIYNTLVMLAHLMDIIDPPAIWRHRLRDLIQNQSFPVASHMGFPANWLSLPIWQP
jgi:abortive infection bacteriophage resistance protein